MVDTRPWCLFLMGPTASGKTDLAVQLVERLPMDIISVDSALIYRGMDIGTAKPDAATLARELRDFRGLPHRLNPIGVHREIACYDDSKSTTPEATLLAVESLGPGHGHIHLIAGGYDKGVSLEKIAALGSSSRGTTTSRRGARAAGLLMRSERRSPRTRAAWQGCRT